MFILILLAQNFFISNIFVNSPKSTFTSIEKFFCHTGKNSDKLVFYFKKIPKINHANLVSKKSNSKNQNLRAESFDLGKLNISSDVFSYINKAIIKIDGLRKYYKFRLENHKNKSHKLRIFYDKRFISCIRAYNFKAISGFDGFVVDIGHVNLEKNDSSRAKDKKINNNKLKPKIVLDFGHGGIDTGTVGLSKRPEKDIVLKVGRKLKNILEKMGYEIFLTRDGDQTVKLDKRTSVANLHSKDSLFISLHANYSGNKNANGVETYYAHEKLLKKVSLNSFANYCKLDLIYNFSDKLAHSVHNNLLNFINNKKLNKTKDFNINDRKVKKSISQVLLGTEMPAILIELGFLSNEREVKLLINNNYQNLLAQGIALGINSYLNK